MHNSSCFINTLFKEATSFQVPTNILEAYPNTKKLKRACNKTFLHFGTLDSENPNSYGGTNIFHCVKKFI